MDLPVLSSTALLTLLLAVGLFFFIRASTKDRIEVARLVGDRPEADLLEAIQQYFTQRAYRIASVDAQQNQVIYEGLVRASTFLTIFLSLLAAVGILCLSLVLSFLFPAVGSGFLGLLILAPLAGLFYWKKSTRQEQVALQIAELDADADMDIRGPLLVVTGHRDELAELQQALRLVPLSE
ncbi:MAG: cofactor assembly of complex C subunit B [Cyanobacteria bacterium J069]|nr:MAG: cofactor assembly of complex C subunit B [Cyanobacteria bacterium J069]